MDGSTIGDLVKAAGGQRRSRAGTPYPRRSVSVPKDVGRRMLDYPGVNWSGVARKAFVDLLDLLDEDRKHGE